MIANVSYPGPSGHITWQSGFKFPKAFAKELKKKFPDWRNLHKALDGQDEGSVWGFLDSYEEKLSKVGPEQLLKALGSGTLPGLLEQAREAVKFKAWRKRLYPRFFPERVKAQKEEQRMIRAQYE